MRGMITVELPDTPGQLTKVITPLADSGCNILNIQHIRELEKEGIARVEITFQTDNKIKLDSVVESLKKKGLIIINYSPNIQTFRETIILIGHVFTTDITDTIIQIARSGIQVASVDARITLIEEVSSVKMTLQSNSEENLKKGIGLLKEICSKKNLFLIRSVRE